MVVEGAKGDGGGGGGGGRDGIAPLSQASFVPSRILLVECYT